MRKFGKEWDNIRENFYRSAIGKKEYVYMYRVKQLDGIGQPVDTWRRQNDKRQPFRTLREAETHRKAFVAEIMGRTLESVGKPNIHTIQDIFNSYIENRCTSLAPNTISKRRGDMENHVIPHFGKRRIETITVGEVKNFILGLRSKYAYRTVKSILATMAIVWQYAQEMRIIDRTVYLEMFVDRGQKVTVPKKVQGQQNAVKKPEIFTNAELERFFEYAKGKGSIYYMLLLLCYYGGVRRSEALGLCWKDIDWNRQEITVSRQLIYDKNTHQTYFSTTKSKVDRTFQVAPTLLNALEEWRREQSVICKGVKNELIGNGISCFDLILHDANGMMTNSKANHFREKAQKDLDMHFIYHGLRHTVVSNLAGAGVPLKSVADFIGHADTRTTEEFYLNTDATSQSKLVAALQNLQHKGECGTLGGIPISKG